MLIPISKNIFINPDTVSVVEQLNGELWVWIDGRPYTADKEYIDDIFSKIVNRISNVPDKWEGR